MRFLYKQSDIYFLIVHRQNFKSREEADQKRQEASCTKLLSFAFHRVSCTEYHCSCRVELLSSVLTLQEKQPDRVTQSICIVRQDRNSSQAICTHHPQCLINNHSLKWGDPDHITYVLLCSVLITGLNLEKTLNSKGPFHVLALDLQKVVPSNILLRIWAQSGKEHDCRKWAQSIRVVLTWMTSEYLWMGKWCNLHNHFGN